MRIKFLSVLITFSFLFSCKKDQPAVPVLNGEITSPQNGFNCNFGDTISVTGFLSCDQPIQTVFLSLVDENFQTIIAGKNIGENPGTSFNFSTQFALDNFDAASGNYFLRISVRSADQVIFLSETKKLDVTAIPRTTLKTFCIAGTAGNPKLYDLSGSAPALLTDYNLSFLNLHIDSRYKKIYVCGKEKIIGLNSDSGTEEFEISPVALNSDSFITSEIFSHQLVLGRNDGNIIFYNPSGLRQNETGENLFIRPLLTTSTSGYLYSSILKNSDRKIAVHFLPGGEARQELLVDFDIVNFYPQSANDIVVIANRNGHTLILEYHLSTNNYNLLSDLPATVSRFSISYVQGVILIFTDRGILKYDRSSNANQMINPAVFRGAGYDEVNNILYCFSGNNIKQLNGSSYADLGDISLTDSVMAVGILYSK